jgi:ELWxxDGT repeat protein
MAETRILFSAAGDGFGKELWMTSGGDAMRLTDVNAGSAGSFPSVFAQYGKWVYFSADSGDGRDLYRLDTITLQVSGVGPANSDPSYVAGTPGKLYLSMYDAVNGRELWVANESGGVSLTGDAYGGSTGLSPSFGGSIGSTVLFAGSDEDAGRELFVSNGGTPTLLKDIRAIGNSEPGYVSGFHEFGNQLLFSANDGGGETLWSSNGSTASELSDVELPQNFFTYDNGIDEIVLFSGQTPGGFDQYIYVTDGTGGGTKRLTTKVEEPAGFTLYKGKVYFSGRDDDHGRELWVTDGTAGGTQRVADLYGGTANSSPSNMVVVNGKLMFTTYNSGYALWTSDGTDEGTDLVRYFTNIGNFVPFGSKAYFAGYTSAGQWQIWETSGTNATATNLMPSSNVTPTIHGVIQVGGSNKPTSGPDELTGNSGDNTIDGKKGDDTIDGAGGDDTLKGSEGDDVLKGGSGRDSLDGGDGKDNLQGGSGRDKLKGGGGNDTLRGGADNDTLDGGSGKDQFRFDTAPNSKSNVDHITNFKVGEDKVALDDSKFDVGSSLTASEFLSRSSGHTATKASQHIIYDRSNGELWYDEDGKGGKSAVKFAVIDNKPAGLSVDDFMIV